MATQAHDARPAEGGVGTAVGVEPNHESPVASIAHRHDLAVGLKHDRDDGVVTAEIADDYAPVAEAGVERAVGQVAQKAQLRRRRHPGHERDGAAHEELVVWLAHHELRRAGVADEGVDYALVAE